MCPHASVNPRGRTKIRSFPYVSKILLPSFYLYLWIFMCRFKKKVPSFQTTNVIAKRVMWNSREKECSPSMRRVVFVFVCSRVRVIKRSIYVRNNFFFASRVEKFRYDKYEASKKDIFASCALFWPKRALFCFDIRKYIPSISVSCSSGTHLFFSSARLCAKPPTQKINKYYLTRCEKVSRVRTAKRKQTRD